MVGITKRNVTSHSTRAIPIHVRHHNRALVLRTAWEQGSVSRAELSRLTGISGPIITDIVNELLMAKLVREDGLQQSSGGRRATALRIAEQARYVVGVDLARDRTRVAISDLNGRLLHRLSVPTSDLPDPQANLRWLQDLIAAVLAEHAISRERLLGIGIGAPGPLSNTTGEILAPTNFGHWQRLPIRSTLESRFGVSVRVDNDANACALAQQLFGVGRNTRNFVYFAAGSGVGAGLVMNGEIYRGGHDLAGEIGHTTVEPNGPLCPCGNRGCLELYTTVRATLARWPGASLPITPVNEILEAKALIMSARNGDQQARNALATTARYLSIGVINAINAYDPDLVIIGRELADAGDLVIDPIREEVARRAFPTAMRRVLIEPDLLAEDTPLLGAVCLVLRELFVDTSLLSNLILSSEGSSDGHPVVRSRSSGDDV